MSELADSPPKIRTTLTDLNRCAKDVRGAAPP